ncbi:hypothetical protein NQZ68_037182 [Dissostichus eleginoides]|nr:hypothetical protein NQZ68_037182 [Dissostichus eleginoides]
MISSMLGSVAAEGAEGTTGGEASNDSSITVEQIGQNGEYLGTARLPAQTNTPFTPTRFKGRFGAGA